MSFFYIVASVTGCFLVLLICVVVMLFKSRKNAKRPQDLFFFESLDPCDTCKSAPISRRSSPTRDRRGSCPSGYGTVHDDITCSSPDAGVKMAFETEHVQPTILVFDENMVNRSYSAQTSPVGSIGSRKFNIAPIRVASEGSIHSCLPPVQTSLHGRIWFTAVLDPDNRHVIVRLNKVKELQGRSEEEPYRDPFVRVFLLPDEHTYHTSRIHKKTLSPVFNEVFTFQLQSERTDEHMLRFSVYDVDRRRIRHSLGHAVVPLDQLDLTSSEIVWRDLENSLNRSPSIGELNIAMTYLPQMERMKVIILKARNIRRPSDPDTGFFVRLHYHYGTKLSKTKQTLIKPGGTEIHFNESFSFSTSNKNIEHFHFQLSLMQTHRSSLSRDVEIGHVTVGSFMYARGDCLLHWQEMLNKTRSIVTKWHQLSMPTV